MKKWLQRVELVLAENTQLHNERSIADHNEELVADRLYSTVLLTTIKMSGIESQSQEEAACMCMFRPM